MAEPATDNSIVITFAVREETKSFKGVPGVRRFLTGMGRDNAERAIYSILEKLTPQMVLTCGFAGGLNPALKNNEIVFQAHDGSILHDQIKAAGATPVNFFCARRVAITSDEKLRLWRGTGLDAVEMESEAIRDICRERNVPSATIRVISDSAAEDLPLDFNTLMTPAHKIHYGKLSWALIRSPLKFAELLAFQQKTIEAAKALGEFLDHFLKTAVLK